MSLLSPGLVLPLTPPTEHHLFLDDPFFEQTRHHFDLTVKQMSNRWSLSSPDHLSPFRSLHPNSVSKEDSDASGTKQHRIIEIQIESDNGDDTSAGNKTKNAFSDKSKCSTPETSTASEASSSQESRDQNQKTSLAGEPAEEETKRNSLVGGLSLHRTLLPTLHQDPFFDDSFFRDVQSDFEETFDSILYGHNAKASSKNKLEESQSIPKDEAINKVETNAQPENISDQKDAMDEQVSKGCDEKVKGDKCLVEEGQVSKTCAGSVFSHASRPRSTLPKLPKHSSIDSSLSISDVPADLVKDETKGCQDTAHIIPDEAESKTDDVTEELSNQNTDEHSEMDIDEEVQEPLFNDEETFQPKMYLESSLDTIMEEPSTPLLQLQEEKDIFSQELCNKQLPKEDTKDQDSNSNELKLDNPELLKQDSNIKPEITSPIVESQVSDQPDSVKNEETPQISSQQETDNALSCETDLREGSPVKLESVSNPLSSSLKSDKSDTSDVIRSPKKPEESIMKSEDTNEGDRKTSPKESEEMPPTGQQSPQISPQSKRNSRVRFEDLPEQQHSEQQEQSSKTQESDNQHKPCIKQHPREKKDQDRKNKRLHLYIPEIKISEIRSEDCTHPDSSHTSGQRKSPQDNKSLEQSLQQEQSQQEIVQAPVCDTNTSTSSHQERTGSTNSTLSESSDICKTETSSTVNGSNKESQEDPTNNKDSSHQKSKNDTNSTRLSTSRSEETILAPTNPKDDELPIQRRGSFFRDSSFKDDHKHFRSAVSKVLERFGIRSSAGDELKAYRTLRRWISMEENQAAKFIDGKNNYKVVLDMSDFSDVKVKVDGQILVVEGYPLGKESNSNQISRRCFIFPASVDMGSVTSSLSSDGVLAITGPKGRRNSLCQEDAIR